MANSWPVINMLQFLHPILLAGPADLDIEQFKSLADRQFAVIAADGGANFLLANGVIPTAIIGDMDSFDLSTNNGTTNPALLSDIKIIRIEEQDSTDFEKCLYSVEAPLFLAAGFAGKRFDHTLANLHTIAKYHPAKKVLLLGQEDISFVHRGNFQLAGEENQIFSIFPLAPIKFSYSKGLEYNLDGLQFEIGNKIGTSNRTTGTNIEIAPSAQYQDTSYLITLTFGFLDELLKKFQS